jgi:hypothetical protein
MIDSKEIRIGNYVFDKDWDAARPIGATDIYNMAIKGSENYQPIELTPEWVERCGFESTSKTEDVFKYSFSESHYILIGKLRKNIEFTMFELWFTDNNGDAAFPYTLPDINHLHTLQNLIHSLTGKELTIKSNDNVAL